MIMPHVTTHASTTSATAAATHNVPGGWLNGSIDSVN